MRHKGDLRTALGFVRTGVVSVRQLCADHILAVVQEGPGPRSSSGLPILRGGDELTEAFAPDKDGRVGVDVDTGRDIKEEAIEGFHISDDL